MPFPLYTPIVDTYSGAVLVTKAMTPHRLPVIWLHKLLVLCRRWASQSLKGLLRLLSRLVQWLDSCRADDGTSTNNRQSSQGVSNSESVRADVHLRPGQKAISQTTAENTVVLSYSSLPIVPPPVHTQGRFMSTDSRIPRSPTLLDEPGSLSALGYEVGRRHSTSLCSTGETSTFTHGVVMAEPEHMTAEPISFKPTVPSNTPRYNRDVKIENYRGPWIFKPLKTLAIGNLQTQRLEPWQYYVHPDGQPYYSCKQGPHRFSYLTEADPSNPAIRLKLDRFMDAIESKANDPEFLREIPPNVEVALEIEDDDEWQYYMIDLDQRSVFWLDEYDLGSDLGPNDGVELEHHLRHLLTFEFWQHIETFPISPRQPPKGLFGELLDILNYFNIDSISSIDSTAPYGNVETQSLIASVKHLQSANDMCPSSFAIVSLARLMGVIANERRLNFYGFEGARITAFQSVRGQPSNKRSWLVKCFSPVLFYAPDTHLKRLERLYVDGILRLERWKTFQAKLEKDWNEFVLYSTVLLNANVAFLSIPNVDSDNGPMFWSSPAAVASLVSIVASLSSIIVGLLLGRQLRVSSKDEEHTPHDAIAYLSRREHKQLGLETIAIQYSLPYALLMWGMVTFSASIAIICFYKVDATPNLLTRMIYTAVWLFILPLILWTILTGWEITTKSSWKELPVTLAEWWKERVRRDPLRLGDGIRFLTRGVKRDRNDEISLAETATANNHDQDSTAPLTAAEKGRMHMRFGPVRRLTQLIGRRFSRP